jgi:hypothetical protein
MAELRLVMYARTGDKRWFERWMLETGGGTMLMREFVWKGNKVVAERRHNGDWVPWPR